MDLQKLLKLICEHMLDINYVDIEELINTLLNDGDVELEMIEYINERIQND